MAITTGRRVAVTIASVSSFKGDPPVPLHAWVDPRGPLSKPGHSQSRPLEVRCFLLRLNRSVLPAHARAGRISEFGGTRLWDSPLRVCRRFALWRIAAGAVSVAWWQRFTTRSEQTFVREACSPELTPLLTHSVKRAQRRAIPEHLTNGSPFTTVFSQWCWWRLCCREPGGRGNATSLRRRGSDNLTWSPHAARSPWRIRRDFC